MQFFNFWTALLLAGATVCSSAIGTGIPARTLDAAWHSRITAVCSGNPDKCLALSIQSQSIGIWDGKVIFVRARRDQEAAALNLIDAQVTGLQRSFVRVAASTARPGAGQ